MTKLRQTIFALLASNLIVVALVSAVFVRRSLRPLTDLTERVASFAQHLKASSPSQSRDGKPVFTPQQASSRDEPAQLAEIFNQMAAAVNNTLRQMHQFVSDASHELRTPLSILQGEADLLLRKPRSAEEYHRAVTVIQTELRHLRNIVEGLFTLSMADAGQLRIARDSLYLNDPLEEACDRMTQLAQAKRITIERRCFDEALAVGDEALLRELFLIFLDNAIKYSMHHTSIQVSLKVEDDTARVTFADQGVGVGPEHLPHIFERFYRASLSGADDTQGGGLGLAIATAIAEVHGGAIECNSILGQGSVFTVRLPVQRSVQL